MKGVAGGSEAAFGRGRRIFFAGSLRFAGRRLFAGEGLCEGGGCLPQGRGGRSGRSGASAWAGASIDGGRQVRGSVGTVQAADGDRAEHFGKFLADGAVVPGTGEIRSGRGEFAASEATGPGQLGSSV